MVTVTEVIVLCLIPQPCTLINARVQRSSRLCQTDTSEKRKFSFQDKWLLDPDLRDWVKSIPGDIPEADCALVMGQLYLLVGFFESYAVCEALYEEKTYKGIVR